MRVRYNRTEGLGYYDSSGNLIYKRRKLPVYPKVEIVSEHDFNKLYNHPDLTDADRKVLISLEKAQNRYRILTKAKYAYFLTIHNKYYAIHDMKYESKIKTPYARKKPIY